MGRNNDCDQSSNVRLNAAIWICIILSKGRSSKRSHYQAYLSRNHSIRFNPSCGTLVIILVSLGRNNCSKPFKWVSKLAIRRYWEAFIYLQLLKFCLLHNRSCPRKINLRHLFSNGNNTQWVHVTLIVII